MEAKPGDKVKVKTEEEEQEGVLMPQEADNVVIKLDSGYNVGIDKKKIKKIEVVEKHKEKKVAKGKVTQNDKLPTIAILHTGGTIASKVDYETGGVSAMFTPEELVEMFPELREIVNIESRLVANILSENMQFEHYDVLAREIKTEIDKGVDGVIITHGTDTMGYTAAALSFILEDLSVPVLIVGAQRSSDRGSSDAFLNLVSAAYFIANSDFAEVGVCMHKESSDTVVNVLPGTKTRKFHTSRRDAFKAVNDTTIAEVDYHAKKIKFIKKDFHKKGGETTITEGMEKKVGLIKMHPDMMASQLACFKGYKGLIVEGTGLGHMPIVDSDEHTKENAKIRTTLKDIIDSGCIVVMTSQCIYGRVNMNVYSAGREAMEIGVIGGEDMLTETAYMKLAWLLKNYPEQAAEKMVENLKGEITEGTNPESTIE